MGVARGMIVGLAVLVLLVGNHPPIAAQSPSIAISGAWARRAGEATDRREADGSTPSPRPGAQPAGGAANGAVYAIIRNAGTDTDALVSAWSEEAEAVELHEVQLDAGVARMRPVSRIEVPAGGAAELKPGGYHVMLLGLRRELTSGETVPVLLRFERADSIRLEVPIR